MKIYSVSVYFEEEMLTNGKSDLIVLSEKLYRAVKNMCEIRIKATLTTRKSSKISSVAPKPVSVDLLINSNQAYIKEYMMWNLIPLRTHYAWSMNSSFRTLIQSCANNQIQLIVGNEADEAVLLVSEENAMLVTAGVNLLLQQKLSSSSFPKRVEVLQESLRKANYRVVEALVSRENILRDGCKFLLSLSDNLERIRVTFKDEMGIDAGGLTKEFFTLLQQELFVDSGLFVPAKYLVTQISPNTQRSWVCDTRVLPNGILNIPHLEKVAKKARLSVDQLFRVCGVICARVIVDNLIHNIPHHLPVILGVSLLKQLLGLSVSVYDFQCDDKELYNSVIEYILHHDPSDLEINFTQDIYNESQQVVKTIHFHNNPNQLVDEQNKTAYLKRLAQYRLHEANEKHTAEFIAGFRTILREDLIAMFSHSELLLLCCYSKDVSAKDLKSVTTLSNLSQDSKEVVWFWSAVESFTDVERAKLIQFITGSSTLPIGDLVAKPEIVLRQSTLEMDSLPVAHTCFNTLDLPAYSSYRSLHSKLVIAINEGQSFAIS